MECLLILLGAYRFSGILPGEEIKSAVDKKRNVTCKPFPERQASGRIRLASQGFSQRNGKAVLRTPAHLIRYLSLMQFKRKLSIKDYHKLYMRGVQFRAEHEKRNRHSQGVPIPFLVTRGRIELPFQP